MICSLRSIVIALARGKSHCSSSSPSIRVLSGGVVGWRCRIPPTLPSHTSDNQPCSLDCRYLSFFSTTYWYLLLLRSFRSLNHLSFFSTIIYEYFLLLGWHVFPNACLRAARHAAGRGAFLKVRQDSPGHLRRRPGGASPIACKEALRGCGCGGIPAVRGVFRRRRWKRKSRGEEEAFAHLGNSGVVVGWRRQPSGSGRR